MAIEEGKGVRAGGRGLRGINGDGKYNKSKLLKVKRILENIYTIVNLSASKNLKILLRRLVVTLTKMILISGMKSVNLLKSGIAQEPLFSK